MTHYDTLGVAPDASVDEIRQAYRRLAKQFHPDVDPSPSAARRFAAISQAYRVLCDPRERLSYNQSVLTSAAARPQAPEALTRRELWAAWQRVGAYGVTGAVLGLFALVGARWLGGAEPVWSVADLWPMTTVGLSLGLLWGIDANFVIADFVSRPILWFIRLLRFVAWPAGLIFVKRSAEHVALVGHPLPPIVDARIELGLVVIGTLIALVATVRDH